MHTSGPPQALTSFGKTSTRIGVFGLGQQMLSALHSILHKVMVDRRRFACNLMYPPDAIHCCNNLGDRIKEILQIKCHKKRLLGKNSDTRKFRYPEFPTKPRQSVFVQGSGSFRCQHDLRQALGKID